MSDPRQREPDERLAAWVDGCLSERDRDRFVAELRVSPQLRQDLEQYERTVAAVRAALRAPTQPVDIADRVLAAIGKPVVLPVPARSGATWRPLVWSLLTAAALLALAVWLNGWLPRAETTDLAFRDAAPTAQAEMGDLVEADKRAEADKAGGREPANSTNEYKKPGAADALVPAADGEALARGGADRPGVPGQPGTVPPVPASGLAEEEPARGRLDGVPVAGTGGAGAGPGAVTGGLPAGAPATPGSVPTDPASAPTETTTPSKEPTAPAAPAAVSGEPTPGTQFGAGREAGDDASTLSAKRRGGPAGGRAKAEAAAAAPVPLVVVRGRVRSTDGEERDAVADDAAKDARKKKDASKEAANPASRGAASTSRLDAEAPASPEALDAFFLQQAMQQTAAGTAEKPEVWVVEQLQAAAPAGQVAGGGAEATAGFRLGGLRLSFLPPPVEAQPEVPAAERKADQSLAVVAAKSAAPVAQRVWLVEGSQAEVAQLLRRLAEFARRTGLELSNGEEPADSVWLQHPEVRARFTAGSAGKVPETAPVGTAKKSAAPEPARLLLRFQTQS